MGVVTYPSEAKPDSDKLTCVYNLIEQARLYHNAQGAIASADWKLYADKWHAYADAFGAKLLPLLQEQNRLRALIKAAHYSPDEWNELDIEERYPAFVRIFGDKALLKEQPTMATSTALDQIAALDINAIDALPSVDPVEDFTTYDERDTLGCLGVTATKIISQNPWLRCGDDAYVKDDKGGGHFGDFEHLITVYYDWQAGTGAFWGFWGLTNGATTVEAMINGSDGFCAYIEHQPTDVLELLDATGGGWDTDAYGCSTSTIYYCTIERDDTTLTCKIYSDSDRTDLLDTLSLTVPDTTLQHVFGFISRDHSARNEPIAAYSENLDLQEGVAASAVVYGFVV